MATRPPLVQYASDHALALGVATTGLLLVVGGLAWRFRWLQRGAALIAAFTRLDKRAVSGHRHRRALLDLITQRPGLDTRALVDATRLNEGTAEYHLRVLEREELVKSVLLGRTRAWYATGSPAPDARAAALRDPSRQRIVSYLSENGTAGVTDIASAVGLAKATVHEHLRVLETAGVLARVRRGARPGYAVVAAQSG